MNDTSLISPTATSRKTLIIKHRTDPTDISTPIPDARNLGDFQYKHVLNIHRTKLIPRTTHNPVIKLIALFPLEFEFNSENYSWFWSIVVSCIRTIIQIFKFNERSYS